MFHISALNRKFQTGSVTDTKTIPLLPENMLKQLFSYSFPAVLSMLVASLCNITDRLFIGDTQGTLALAGLALTLPLMVLLTAVGSLIGTGASILLARLRIPADKKEAERILGNTLIGTVSISLLLIYLLSVFQKEILFLLGGRKQTIAYAACYLYIAVPGSIFTHLSVGLSNCMRACGQARKAASILLGGITANLFLNGILAYSGKISIENCARTTVVSMFLCTIPILLHFTGRHMNFRFPNSGLYPSLYSFWKIIRTGLTPFFMNMTICTVSIIINNYLVIYGGYRAIGAFGIISSYTIPLMMMLAGFCQGMRILIRYKDIPDKFALLRKTLTVVTLLTCSGLLAGELLSPYFIGFFTTDSEVTRMATCGLQIIFCTLPILGFQFVIAGFFQSLDKTRKALFINMSRQFVFLIPSLFIFSGFWGITGIWAAIPFSDLMATALTAFLLLSERKKWIRPGSEEANPVNVR